TNQQVIQIGTSQSQQQQQPQSSGNPIVVGNNQQLQGVVLNQQQQQEQNTVSLNHNLIQQLIANSGTNPGDIQSIQINPDGQIQLIKVPGSETNQEQI
uniref:Uncharacterized protein n=1 Tax=Ciona savignyi TaxID=51511 RepID=H2YS40_CIOSA